MQPYNVNTQQTRTRYWDGHDNMFRDDVTWLHGKHLIQFGGMYQHNYNWHQRTDNGGGINYYPVYQLGTTSGAGIDMSGYVPANVASTKNWGRDYAAMLGIVSVSQIAYTRSGNNLTLNPPLTPATDKVTIPYYNFYGSDTWRMTPRFTLTFGLGWTLEMPPREASGKQVIFVGPDNKPISTEQYLNAREQAALQGQVYNPQVGFSLVGNTAHPSKYPYNPFYGEWSPRIAAAWDMFGDGTTVIRGGYGRTYGRLNGVDLVLVPLLGTGLIQPVQCFNAMSNGTCGTTSPSPTNAFRVGSGWFGCAYTGGSPDVASATVSRRERRCRGCGRGARSELPSQQGGHIHLHVPASTQQQGEHGDRLHRPAHPQRISADQSERRSVHDDQGRPDLCQGLCQHRDRVLR